MRKWEQSNNLGPPVHNIWCDQSKEQKSLRILYDQNTERINFFHPFSRGGFYLAKLKYLKQIFQIYTPGTRV